MIALLFLATIGFTILFDYYKTSNATEANRGGRCLNCHVAPAPDSKIFMERDPEIKSLLRGQLDPMLIKKIHEQMLVAHP